MIFIIIEFFHRYLNHDNAIRHSKSNMRKRYEILFEQIRTLKRRKFIANFIEQFIHENDFVIETSLHKFDYRKLVFVIRKYLKMILKRYFQCLINAFECFIDL